MRDAKEDVNLNMAFQECIGKTRLAFLRMSLGTCTKKQWRIFFWFYTNLRFSASFFSCLKWNVNFMDTNKFCQTGSFFPLFCSIFFVSGKSHKSQCKLLGNGVGGHVASKWETHSLSWGWYRYVSYFTYILNGLDELNIIFSEYFIRKW